MPMLLLQEPISHDSDGTKAINLVTSSCVREMEKRTMQEIESFDNETLE